MSAADMRPRPFPVTRWSLVARARPEGDAVGRRRALEELCSTYWYPLYAFARGRGASAEDAEDQTQGFFASILESDFFGRASAERGKLRSFFLGAFSHFLANWHRNVRALKRGGGDVAISIDAATAEDRWKNEPAAVGSVEQMFEHRWAMALVEATMAALVGDYAKRGKGEMFSVLRCFLEGTDDEGTYAKSATELGMTVNAVRQEVYRMRMKFRDLLRDAIADTIDGPTESGVDAELAELKRVLGS